MTTWVSCSSRRLFDGSFWLDQTVLSVNNTMPRAGRPSSRAAFEATKFLLHFDSTYNLMAGGRVEHGSRAWKAREGGHCSNLFELASGNKGAWPARSVSRAIRATPSKSRTWAATCLRHFSGLGRKLCRQPDRSADCAVAGRTDFFRLYYSGY